MTNLESRLRTLLSQAQSFARDAPMEAVARARIAAHEGGAALKTADEDTRKWLAPLQSYAEAKVASYEQALGEWQADNHTRAAEFQENERRRYREPVEGLSNG